MAQPSGLSTSTASEYLEILNSLRCPYTEDVEESYISDLLFTPGEHRIRLLLWIFGEIDGSVEAIVNAEDIILRQISDFGVDKRVQVLASLGASFGLCRAADLDLIRGNVSFGKQLTFWEKLFKIVKFSKKQSLDRLYSDDCWLLDDILNPESNLFLKSSLYTLDILPHNLKKEMTMMPSNGKKTLGKLDTVLEEIERLKNCLDIQRAKLAELEKAMSYTSTDDDIVVKNTSRKLALTLSDLDQMMTTFEQTFTNMYLPYCNKQKEEFGNLGQLIEIVNKQLNYILKTFDNLHSIRSSSESISTCTKNWPKTKEKLSRYSSLFENFLSGTLNALDSLSHSLEAESSGEQTDSTVDGSKIFEKMADFSKIY